MLRWTKLQKSNNYLNLNLVSLPLVKCANNGCFVPLKLMCRPETNYTFRPIACLWVNWNFPLPTPIRFMIMNILW